MVAILEKGEHNVDFHPIVDFVEASPLRYALTVKPAIYVSHIRQFWSTARIETTEEGTKILATIDSILRTVTESSLRRNLKLKDEEGIRFNEFSSNIATALVCLATNRTYNFSKMSFNGLVKNVNNKTFTLPHDSAPRVTSPAAAAEGSMQQTLNELTAFCTSLQRKHSELISKFEAQELEINRLKARVKLLEDREGVDAERSGDDAPIKGRNLDEGEAAAKRVSDDTEEIATVLTSMDAATVLASGVADVPTRSGSIPTASPPAAEFPTGSDVVPTAGPVFATATVVTPYRRRKGKEIMVESETPKKKKKVKDFRGMTFEEIEAKFTTVWKQLEDFIPMGSKEEAERLKRKGLSLELESKKKLKTSDEVHEEVKSHDEVPEEKVKEMMQLVPIEEVYVKSIQVKHPIIDWKHMDRKDLNQLWALVKESLSNKQPTSDKEIELGVELKRLYEPDDEDQLWTHTQNLMLALVEWKLYDTCGVHHVTSKDKEIFMLVEKDYPLRKDLAIGRIVGSKMHKAFPLLVIEFSLAEEVPTASEESSHYQKKRDATAKRIALLREVSHDYS
nr:hypothetical protein [Tanacetum cinerariifolium]